MTTITPPPPASPGYRLFLWAYDRVLRLAQPLVWRYLRKRAVKDADYMAFPEERRGRGEPFLHADVWVHAVSIGELNSAMPLIRLLLDRGYAVVTTHATPAGRRAAEKHFGSEIASRRLAVRYAPIDLFECWGEFFVGSQPKVGLVMEMEFWPGMMDAAAAMGVPLVLANSQVPSKSLPRAKAVSRWLTHPVARAAAVFAKSERMAERFRALGARDVRVMGETRFDIPPNPAHVAAGEVLKALLLRPVVTLASVVAGEEEVYLSAVQEMVEGEKAPLFIWVPRAPEKFDETVEWLRDAGLSVAVRSEVFDQGLAAVGDLSGVDVLVGDSFGEMFFYLSAADAVVVGGGFTPKAAHNIIEPLALGKPVITGPSVWTIEYPAVEAEAAGVLRIAKEPGDLVAVLREALASGSAEAEAFHAANAGASARIVEAVLPLLDQRDAV